jgi:magnesium-transporting ATPase (P-type)
MPSNIKTIRDNNRFTQKRVLSTQSHLKQPHEIPLNELCRQFNLCDVHEGLTTAQVQHAQLIYGLNELTTSPQPSYLRLFFLQTFTGFNTVLWIAAMFAFLAYQPFGRPNPDPTK